MDDIGSMGDTTMKLSKETKDRIADYGRAGESLETALIRALDLADRCREKQETKARKA